MESFTTQPSGLETSDISPFSSSFSSSSSSSYFSSLSWTTWLVVILILAFLGFNVFMYLAKGTQEVTDIFAPLTKKLFGATVAVTGQTVDVSAEGAKSVVGGTAGAIQGGLTAVQNITPNAAPGSIKGQPVGPGHGPGSGIPGPGPGIPGGPGHGPGEPDYEANEATSSINSAGKSGWCYIGEDRGFRTCAQVGASDTCMSGEIFPSQEICMNPALRA